MQITIYKNKDFVIMQRNLIINGFIVITSPFSLCDAHQEQFYLG